MGKSKRKQKAKQEDFKKVKFKVGKKLKKQQDTNTSFRSTKLIIQDQLGGKENEADQSQTSQPRQSLAELCNYLKHHKSTGRKEALQKIKNTIIEDPSIVRGKLPLLLPAIAALFSDEDAGIRRNSAIVLQNILSATSETALGPHFELLVAHLSCALSHIQTPIKFAAIEALESLLEIVPNLCRTNSELFNSLMAILSTFSPTMVGFDVGTIGSASQAKVISKERKFQLLKLLNKFVELKTVEAVPSAKLKSGIDKSRILIKTDVESVKARKRPIMMELAGEKEAGNPFFFPVLYPNLSQRCVISGWKSGEEILSFVRGTVPFLFGLWAETSSGEQNPGGILDFSYGRDQMDILETILTILISAVTHINVYRALFIMGSYCPPGVSFLDVWTNEAFNPCLVDTLKAVLLALLMSTCGVLEFRMYRRFGTPLDPGLLKPIPPLYIVQITFSIVVFVLQPLRFGLRFLGGDVYGYSILLDVVGTIVWFCSALLIFVERNYDLPSAPGRGHSIYLNVFWGAALILDSLEVINVRGPAWWFTLENGTADAALLTIFILQWISELALFLLGMKAPGIVTNRQRNQFFYRPMEEHPKYGSVSSAGEGEDMIFEKSIDILRQAIKSSDFEEEFLKLDRQSLRAPINVAKERRNEPRNRYWNVLPYDFNRIVIKNSTVLGGDYINASSINIQIDDMEVNNNYIAAQGPKPETITDFWQMVWENKTPLILMLTELVEGGMRKCEKYWPEVSEKIQLDGGLVVGGVTEENPSKACTVREFFLVDLETQQNLTVVQLHFHGWPDHGAPKETKRFLEYWRNVRNRLPLGEAPPVIHCSAGIGRTGAYILMETLILMIEAEIPLRPVEIVRQLRDQRMAMVQTKEQFLYACKTALDYYDQKKKRRR